MFNVQVPVEGPCAIPLQLDFSVSTTYFVDGRGITDRPGYFSMIQTLWIDTTNASGNVSVLIGGINQLITAKQGTQGYYPVLCPNSFHLTITCSGSTGLVNVDLINVPIAPGVWPPSTGGGGSGTVSSVGLSSTDLAVSGSPVTTAGSITANLNTTGVTPGTYGDSTHVGQFAVDAKGRISAASNVAIAGGGGGAVTLLLTQSGAAASYLFPTVFSANPGILDFEVRIRNLIPSNNNVDFHLQFTTDSGVTYDVTAANYVTRLGYVTTGGLGNAQSNDAGYKFGSSISNNANYGLTGRFMITNPTNAALFKLAIGTNIDFDANANATLGNFNSMGYTQAVVVTGFRLIPSAGTWASGSASVYSYQS